MSNIFPKSHARKKPPPPPVKADTALFRSTSRTTFMVITHPFSAELCKSITTNLKLSSFL